MIFRAKRRFFRKLNEQDRALAAARYCTGFFDEREIFYLFIQKLNSGICGNCGICGNLEFVESWICGKYSVFQNLKAFLFLASKLRGPEKHIIPSSKNRTHIFVSRYLPPWWSWISRNLKKLRISPNLWNLRNLWKIADILLNIFELIDLTYPEGSNTGADLRKILSEKG